MRHINDGRIVPSRSSRNSGGHHVIARFSPATSSEPVSVAVSIERTQVAMTVHGPDPVPVTINPPIPGAIVLQRALVQNIEDAVPVQPTR